MMHTGCGNDIALLGMACNFPGTKGLTQFWYNLVNGIDVFSLPSTLRQDTADRCHTPCVHEVNSANPLLLRDTIEQALQDADILPGQQEIRSQTRLILGQNACRGGMRNKGNGYELPARLSKELCLGGEVRHGNAAETISLRALALGVQDLREGRCDALVFAVAYLGNDDGGEKDIRKPDTGKMQPFDDSPYPAFEGAAAVVLKRRGDAETAGDRAYALIKGIANTPEVDLHEAYSKADITPEDIGLLETAVGGLLCGNTDELNTVKAIFGSRHESQSLRPLGVIACDSDRAGAGLGLASLIKAGLCLSNKIIPPTLYDEVLPTVPDQVPFYLNVEARPWIHDGSSSARCAAVNALDPNGGVTHIILEEIANDEGSGRILPRPIKNDLPWDSELVVLTAENPFELTMRIDRLLVFLKRKHPGANLIDVAYMQCVKFDSRAKCRLAIVSTDLEDLEQQLSLCYSRLQTPSPSFEDVKSVYFSPNGNRRSGKIAFLFPGQGFPGLLGPYGDHLFDLCLRFPEVRAAFDLADRRDGHPKDPLPTNQLFFPPATFPEEERRRLRQRLASPRLADGDRMKIIAERDLSSFGVTIANWGSWNLLQRLGVPVDMYFGQSHGELSALCSAGAMDFTEVLPMHWEVHYDPEEFIASNGRLALIYASEERLTPLLERFRNVNIAVHVSPDFQILGGEAKQIGDIIREVRKSGIWTQTLPYPAIHTPYFSLLRPELESFLNKVSVHPFRVPVYSAMTCDVYPDVPDMVRQIMIANLDCPVLLWQTIQKMYNDGARIFIQLGGGATMYAQAKNIIGSDDVIATSVDVDYRSAISQLNHMCATLLTNCITLNLEHLYEYRTVKNLDIDFTEAKVTGLVIDSGEDAIAPSVSELFRENMRSEGLSQDEVSSLDEPRMPFIGKVLHYTANREIVIERNLDLKEDLFLKDHILLYADGIKPISAQLPVLPMTVGMEMLAEVAACLAPGYGLIRFEDIRATRWIELVHAESLTLRTSAHLDHYDEVRDTYRIVVDLFIEKEVKPAIQATVWFGRNYQVNVELEFSPPQNPIRYPLSPKQIYEARIMFHGPNFQSLSGDTVLAERSVVGELGVLPKSNMFYSTQQPELLTDPNLLDGVGQLIGLWAIEKNVYVFPIGIRKLEIYCPTPAVNTRVPVIVEISHYNSKFLKADVEVQDGAGHVWMRIQEWGDWVFKWPKKAYNFRRRPTKYCTSHGLVLAGLPNGAVAQHISKADIRDLPLHHMAGFYLHMDEMPTFWALQEAPTRQFQWLIGRIAAKDAIRRWLTQDKSKEMLHPAAFSIENDEKRRPVIKNVPGHLGTPRLSISHSGDRAVALVHSDAIGIDIEQIANRDETFLKTIASQGEIKLLGDFLSSEPGTWVTRLWCAKEASGKLIGIGFEGSPQRFEAIDINVSGIITVFHHDSGRSVLVHTKQEGDFIIAYAAEPLA